jgi:hypothetical protein
MDTVSAKIAALPTWQTVFVAIAGSLVILTAMYLLSRGYIMPIATVAIIAFLMFLTIVRMTPPPPSPSSETQGDTQYTVFRSMEPADQTRVNAWMGILQEDVYANRTGPIGDFIGNDDYARNAPLYPIS